MHVRRLRFGIYHLPLSKKANSPLKKPICGVAPVAPSVTWSRRAYGFFEQATKLVAIKALFLVLIISSAFAAESADPSISGDKSALDFANGLYARKMYEPAIEEYQKFIRNNPASPLLAEASFRAAESYFFMKKYSEAIEKYESFSKAYPQDERAYTAFFRAAMAKYYAGDLQGARRDFFRLSKGKKDASVEAGAFFYLAKIHEADGSKDKAIFVLKRVLLNYPETEYASYAALLAGDIFAGQDHVDEAVEMYKLAADRVEPETVIREASLKIADLLFKAKRFSEARLVYRGVCERLSAAVTKEDRVTYERALTGEFYSIYQEKDSEAAKSFIVDNEVFLKTSSIRNDIYFLDASLASEKNDHSYALGQLEDILSTTGLDEATRTRVMFKKASTLNALGRTEEALSLLKSMGAGASPKDLARSYYERAEILRESGKPEEALDSYGAVLGLEKVEPYFQKALYQSAFIRSQLKKWTEAKRDLAAYLETYPQGEEAERVMLQLVQIDLDEERYEEAEKNTRLFLKRYPESQLRDIAQYKLGTALTGLKKFSEAAESFDGVRASNADSTLSGDAEYAAAVSFEGSGEIKKAINSYESFIKHFPDHALVSEALPHIGFLYIQDKQYEKAAAFYNDLIVNKPKVSVDSATAFWVIRYYLDHSQYEKMKALLAALPERYPDEDLRHEVNFFLGEGMMGLRNYVEASRYYSKAIEVNPEGVYVAHSNLGQGLALLALHQPEQAEKVFTRALAFDDEIAVVLRARFEIANLQLAKGLLDEAARAFMHVAILYNDEKYCPIALFKAAECFEKLGRKEEGERAYQELVSRYPKSPFSVEAQARLSRVEKSV